MVFYRIVIQSTVSVSSLKIFVLIVHMYNFSTFFFYPAEHTRIHLIPVTFRVIVISDGKGTPDIVSSGEDDFPVNLETTVMVK